MADASARIEQRLRAPALFVNGASGDVSPTRHGWNGVREAGVALSHAALAAWDQVAPESEARLAVLAAQPRQVRLGAERRQVVEQAHSLTDLKQSVREVGPDEARAAEDQRRRLAPSAIAVAHKVNPRCSRL